MKRYIEIPGRDIISVAALARVAYIEEAGRFPTLRISLVTGEKIDWFGEVGGGKEALFLQEKFRQIEEFLYDRCAATLDVLRLPELSRFENRVHSEPKLLEALFGEDGSFQVGDR